MKESTDDSWASESQSDSDIDWRMWNAARREANDLSLRLGRLVKEFYFGRAPFYACPLCLAEYPKPNIYKCCYYAGLRAIPKTKLYEYMKQACKPGKQYQRMKNMKQQFQNPVTP